MLLALLSIQLVGLAEGDRFELSLDKGAAAERCISEEELKERVRSRIGSEPFADETGELKSARRLVVRVARAKRFHKLEAQISLFDEDGSRLGQRTLRGALDCEQ